MKQRIEVGTDIAQFGVWDESCSADALSGAQVKQLEATLASDAKDGRLFLIQLGGDWGGTVDVYVDSEVEPDTLKEMRQFGNEYLVAAPSGRLIVGGVEDYRRPDAQITSESSVVSVAPGEYGVTCYMRESSEGDIPDMPGPEELEAAVGSELYSHYRLWHARSTKGFWLLLLFFPITYWFGLILGLAATVVAVIGFFHLVERMQNRDPKYVEASAAVEAAMIASDAAALAIFVLVLRSLVSGHELTGGRVEVC